MPNRPSTPTRPLGSVVRTPLVDEPQQEFDWRGATAKSKVLSLIFSEHQRDGLPVYPTISPSYLSEGVARYRVDFRDETAGKGRILVSFRVVCRVVGAEMSLVECVRSDYR